MAKGQKRSTREVRKPKAEKPKPKGFQPLANAFGAKPASPSKKG